jgi:hypothetical protein
LTPEQLVKLAKDMKKQEEEDDSMEIGDLMVTFYLKPQKVCHALVEHLNGLISVTGGKGASQFLEVWRTIHAPDK